MVTPSLFSLPLRLGHIHRLALVAVAALLCYTPLSLAASNTLTGIFNPSCRTLTTTVNGNPIAPPVITAGNPAEALTVGFDILSDDREYLRYSIYHCDADWSISNITDNEVFDGFNLADITDYAFSRATGVHYVHYSITVPNEDFQFRLSGNYLLRVFPENDPDDIYLQVRFMVSENAVAIQGDVTSRTDIDYNTSHQQLTLQVDLNRYPVRDPFNDLRVIVRQNNRLDNSVTLSHPSRVNGNSAIYEHISSLIFKAGNEYRRFETLQTTYPGMGVETIDYHSPYYHHILALDSPRHSRPYSYDQTQHGRFLVREYNSSDPDTEADYTVVHFTLKMLPLLDAEVFIDGDLTYRHFDDTSKMIYDPEAGVYHKALLLKQGAYNYQYLALPSGGASPAARTADIEGDLYPTVNEYEIAVYYRAPGERFDRLLGYTHLYSGR